MKKFALHLFCLILLTAVLMVLLDKAYSETYQRSNPRNKLEYILKLKNQQFDVVFLGSSRVANHIDAELFDHLSHKKTINLGVEGAGLNDNLLELKLLLKNNRTRFVFLQVDTNLESITPSNISKAEAMPFLKNETVSKHIKKYDPNFRSLYYIPFYRYAINDAKIGFRELFFSAINKKPGVNPAIGFEPKFGNDIYDLPKSKMGQIELLHNNPILNEIKAICKSKNTKLVLFVAPYCSRIDTEAYILKMKTIIPGVIDLSKGFDDAQFYNCGHLNAGGAKILTKRLYEATKDTLNFQMNNSTEKLIRQN